MSKWIFTRPGQGWAYPTLGFTAVEGDIIEADLAPDAWWEPTDPYAVPTIPFTPGGGVTEPDADSLLAYERASNGGRWRTTAELGLVTTLTPLGDDEDDSPRINAALAAMRASGRPSRVILTGRFALGSCLRIGDDQTIDAYAAELVALPGCYYLLETAAMEDMVLARSVAATPSTTGGTLAAGTYAYRVVALTAGGHTAAGIEATAVTTGSTGSVTLTWGDPLVGDVADITGFEVYGRTSGGINLRLASLPAVARSFTDTGAAGTAATPPLLNTTFGRTARAAVHGGVWDVNKDVNPQAGSWVDGLYAGHGFNLQKVDSLTLRDVTVRNARKWCIAIADFTDLHTENLRFDSVSDGIHVVGPGKGWTGRGFYGSVGDDFIGMSLAEWPPYAVSEGDLSGIDVGGIHSTDAPSAVRALLASGLTLHDVTIDGVSGTYTFYKDDNGDPTGYFAKGVIFCNAEQQNPGRKGGTVGALTLRDIYPAAHQTEVVQFDGTFHRVTVDGVRTVTNKAAVVVGENGASDRPTSAQKVELSRIAATNVAGGGVRIAGQYVSVQSLEIDGLNFVTTAAITGYPIQAASQASIARLVIRDANIRSGAASSRDLLYIDTSASVPDILVEGAVTDRLNTFVYVNQSTGVGTITVLGGTLMNGQSIVKTKAPVTVRHRDVKATTVTTAGLVSLFTATATPVAIEGSGASILTSQGLSRDGSQVITALSPTTPCNVALLARTAGTMAHNTNATLSCGVGPVACDGTTWTNLASGATY